MGPRRAKVQRVRLPVPTLSSHGQVSQIFGQPSVPKVQQISSSQTLQKKAKQRNKLPHQCGQEQLMANAGTEMTGGSRGLMLDWLPLNTA